LDVLEQSEGQGILVRGVPFGGPDQIQTGSLVCAPASLAADQLVVEPVRRAAHHDRLKLPPALDGLGQLVQRALLETLADIARVRPDLVDAQKEAATARAEHGG